MAAEKVEHHPSDGWVVLPFETRQEFEAWLDVNHAEQLGLWVRFAKKGRGIGSVSFSEALEVAMCFGWVDSKMPDAAFRPRRGEGSEGGRALGVS